MTTEVASLDCSALLEKATPAPSQLAQLAAEQLERLGGFQPGPLGELLISEIAREVCQTPAVQELRARRRAAVPELTGFEGPAQCSVFSAQRVAM